MNAPDILSYGHRDVLQAFSEVPVDQQLTVGVTTRWSPKDVLAHLASYELLLVDALKFVLGQHPLPVLEAMNTAKKEFNDVQVEARQAQSFEATLEEYTKAHDQVMGFVKELGPERLRETGTIPWYGTEYALDDFIVYANYAHKREHVAELKHWIRVHRS